MAPRHRVKLSAKLTAWYRRGHRDLPWRRTSDPYRIWVSEIMLQQTRAQAAIPYYERFLERFPTVEALAAATETEVLTLWAGLGYYSRARNLHRAAREIAGRGFPRDYESIRALPGIGDYTAAAVASIAFQLPHAVVDGNVLRVVSRLTADAADIGSARTRQRFRAVVEGWLDPQAPGVFNQALMELGATICLPKNPRCTECPLRAECLAHQQGKAAQFPVKLRKKEPVAIAAVLLLLRRNGRVLLRRRDDAERRMAGFWELPMPEHLPGARVGRTLGRFRHTITHHHFTFTVKAATLGTGAHGCTWFSNVQLNEIPLSTTARKALRASV